VNVNIILVYIPLSELNSDELFSTRQAELLLEELLIETKLQPCMCIHSLVPRQAWEWG